MIKKEKTQTIIKIKNKLKIKSLEGEVSEVGETNFL